MHARPLLLLAAGLVVGGLVLVGLGRWYEAGTNWHWTDPGVHAVDGYYVTTEHPCPPDGSDRFCAAAIKTALAADPSLAGSTAATAELPSHWVDGDGVAYYSIRSGVAGVSLVTLLLTLPSGERRTFTETCTATEALGRTNAGPGIRLVDVTTGAGQIPGPPPEVTCQSPGWMDVSSYRVGAWLPGYGIKDQGAPTSAY